MNNDTQSGFTLLEMAIAAGIIAIMGSVIAQTFFTASKSQGKLDIATEVKQNGDFALLTMERMIRQSIRITSTCSSTGSSAKSVSIQSRDGGITTFDLLASDSVVRIASTSGAGTVYLTTPAVTITSPVTTAFTCTTVGGSPQLVKISFTLSQASSGAQGAQSASTPFQSTVALRN